MAQVQERVIAIVAKTFNREPAEIRPEQRLREDLGGDSLDTLEIVMTCEDRFGIEISDDDAEMVQTVAEVIHLVVVLVGRKKV